MPNTKSLSVQIWSLLLISGLYACLAGVARGQSPLDGFDPNANDLIRVVVVQPDGKILIGGDFTTLSPNGGVPVTRNRIARLNADGTLDSTFNPNANGSVQSIALQVDGKILVSGGFSGVNSIGGQPRNRMARLEPATGSADSFNPNPSDQVLAIDVQADGMILVAGFFNGANSIGGATRNRIARLDPINGMADPFDPNANNSVRSIAVQADGKILVGGDFITLSPNGAIAVTRNRIARLNPDGTLDTGFNPNANGRVQSIAIQADGRILAGGNFSGANSIGGENRNRIARLDAVTGAADPFDPNANLSVFAITVQPDGRILVGGSFSGPASIGGQLRNNIARLDPLTGLADAFNPNADALVGAIAIQTDGKILLGGSFTFISPGGGTLTRNHLARVEADGRLDQTLSLNTVGNYVGAIGIQPDGKVLIGGAFTSVLGVPRNNIARLNTDGSLDTAFNPNANGIVNAIAVQTDGKVLVGGEFSGPSSIGGQQRNFIARLDPATGAADLFNPNANSKVFALALQSDGKIIVGGQFGVIGGELRSCIARLDAMTGFPDPFDPSASGIVWALAVQADGKVLAGGLFFGIGGQTRSRIARLDAITGAADSFNPNADGEVDAIALQADGKVLLGGDFTHIGGQARNRVARVDAVTGLADSFDANANSYVLSIAVQTDGHVLVGGYFTGIGGHPQNSVARLNPTTGLPDTSTPNIDNFVYALALQSDGKILVGGEFATVAGQPRNKFARLSSFAAALQDLGVTQTGITWTRSGLGVQFTRVAFESSTDGVNYSSLGNGTQAGSNWTLTGLNLPTGQNIYIRGRGYYRSGYQTGSESVNETVRNAFIIAGATPTATPTNTSTATPTATPTGAPAIIGTVTYGNAISAPVPRFVSNALISSAGSPAFSVFTDGPGATAGQYSLTGFGVGPYTVTPTKTTGQNGITSFDSARIAQHVSGLSLLTGNALVVADVSNNGSVTSFDAAEIANYVVVAAPAGVSGTWKFSPVSRNYASVAADLSGEDYSALLMGEVSGNWTNTGARPGGHEQLQASVVRDSSGGDGPLKNTSVTAPRLVTPADHEVIVPISVDGVADKGVISYEFDLRYDPSVIQPMPKPVDLTDTVSSKLSVAVNADEPGLLRVAVYGAMPIDRSGLLLNLRFTAVGITGSVSPLTWMRLMFDEGEPTVTATDGYIELNVTPSNQTEIVD